MSKFGPGMQEFYDKVMQEFGILLHDIMSEYRVLGDDLVDDSEE